MGLLEWFWKFGIQNLKLTVGEIDKLHKRSATLNTAD
jgi:hypothetical protein